MRQLDRDGVRISWDMVGTGPAILLTHGYMASGHMWQPNIPALAVDHTVISWDNRGHGASDYPDDPAAYSPELALADMNALLDAAEVEQAVILGMSMGGYLSLRFQAFHPERTAGLVAVDCGPGFKRAEGREGWNKLANGYGDSFESGSLDALDRTRTEIKDAPHRDTFGLARVARGMLTQHDDKVMTSLPEVAVPALVIVGELDHRFIPGSEYMAAKIPGARYEVIPAAGHASNMDQPAAFNKVLVDFLHQNGI